jgi:hypothetical protein
MKDKDGGHTSTASTVRRMACDISNGLLYMLIFKMSTRVGNVYILFTDFIISLFNVK